MKRLIFQPLIKHLLTIVVFLLTTSVVQAQSVNLFHAKEIAKNLLVNIGTSPLKSAKIKRENVQFQAAKTEVENKDTLFYILNDSVSNAFVIVSADERAWPVLGYSTQGTFDEGNQPDAFKAWMEERGKEIASIKASNLQADVKTTNEWIQLKSGNFATQTSGVEPLVKTTWSQGLYYNEQCPFDPKGPAGHAWTGCVPTAMAQIMKYWGFPEQGNGSAYLDSKYGQQFADFGSTFYLWDQMPDYLSSTNNEVAKLMFHCGVSLSAWYDIDGTLARTRDIVPALTNYFSYSPDARYITKASVNQRDWNSLLKQELDAKRPIVYGGFSSKGGHTFICDGYQNENFFHFNWGWGGYNDGYFYIEDLSPGIEYNQQQDAIINIIPSDLPKSFDGFFLSTNRLSAWSNKSNRTLRIFSSVDWTVSCNQNWVLPQQNSGRPGSSSIELTIDENTTSTTRVAVLSVSASGYGTQKVIITQPAKINMKAGELHDLMSEELSKTQVLTLTGTIDARDFKTMRDEMLFLEEVDLSQASIVAYSGIEGTGFGNDLQVYPANTIPHSAFMKDWVGKKTLKSIILPATLTRIDWGAFMDCSGLRTFSIPAHVVEINEYALTDCVGLSSITVDENNPNYSSLDGILFNKNRTELIIFPDKNWLSDYTIPESVTSIGKNAFDNCNSLENIIIPQSVVKIGEYAFVNCIGLHSITIPNSVTTIGNGAFNSCLNLSCFNVDKNNEHYCSQDGVLFNKHQTEIIKFPVKKGITNYSIPSSVSTIGDFAFANNNDLDSITLPSNTRFIGIGAFRFCYKLTSVNIPSVVTSIGNEAFDFCTNLTTFRVAQSLPLKLGDQVFSNFNKINCKLYVPYGTKASYQAANQWKDFSNIVEAANGFNLSTNSMQLSADAGSNSSVELKANVNWTVSCDKSWLTVSSMSGISNAPLKFTAEANTSNIPRVAKVIISSSGFEPQQILVTQKGSNTTIQIGAGALASLFPANELAILTILSLSGTIDARDFKTMRDNMPMLEEIDLSKATIIAYSGNGGTDFLNNTGNYPANTIPFSAFMKDWQGKKNLKSIVLPTTLSEIDWSAFRDCDGLKTVVIPPGVVKIGGYVFLDNDGLTSIEIPALVTSIGGGVFGNCINLNAIKVLNPVPVDFTKSQSTDVFTGVNKSTCTLYVPYGTKASYQAADQWKDFLNIVEMPLDHAPYVKNPLQNISVRPGTIDQVIDLNATFADDDAGDQISYSVTGNSNNKIASVKIEGSSLILTFSATEIGITELTVTASSNGKQVTSKFQITLGYPTGNSLIFNSENITIYPNPSEGIFHISFNSLPNKANKLIICDLTGKFIMIKKITQQVECIDLSGQAPGIYLLKTNMKDSEVKKMIVR